MSSPTAEQPSISTVSNAMRALPVSNLQRRLLAIYNTLCGGAWPLLAEAPVQTPTSVPTLRQTPDKIDETIAPPANTTEHYAIGEKIRVPKQAPSLDFNTLTQLAERFNATDFETPTKPPADVNDVNDNRDANDVNDASDMNDFSVQPPSKVKDFDTAALDEKAPSMTPETVKTHITASSTSNISPQYASPEDLMYADIASPKTTVKKNELEHTQTTEQSVLETPLAPIDKAYKPLETHQTTKEAYSPIKAHPTAKETHSVIATLPAPKETLTFRETHQAPRIVEPAPQKPLTSPDDSGASPLSRLVKRINSAAQTQTIAEAPTTEALTFADKNEHSSQDKTPYHFVPEQTVAATTVTEVTAPTSTNTQYHTPPLPKSESAPFKQPSTKKNTSEQKIEVKKDTVETLKFEKIDHEKSAFTPSPFESFTQAEPPGTNTPHHHDIDAQIDPQALADALCDLLETDYRRHYGRRP